MVQATRMIAALALLGCSPGGQTNQERPQLTQDSPHVEENIQAEQQPTDSVVRGVIPREGGVIELPGFAKVTFPPGAFEAPREVTVEATSEEFEREIFVLNFEAPAAAHEIHVMTGATRPATSIEIELTVPDAFLAGLPADRTPDLYTKVVEGGGTETHDKYLRLPSIFDERAKTVRVELIPQVFEAYRIGKGLEATVMIGSRLSE